MNACREARDVLDALEIKSRSRASLPFNEGTRQSRLSDLSRTEDGDEYVVWCRGVARA